MSQSERDNKEKINRQLASIFTMSKETIAEKRRKIEQGVNLKMRKDTLTINKERDHDQMLEDMRQDAMERA